MNRDLLTVQEVAAYLRTSPGAIRNLIWRKKLRAFKPGKKLLIKKDDLDLYLELSRKRECYE